MKKRTIYSTYLVKKGIFNAIEILHMNWDLFYFFCYSRANGTCSLYTRSFSNIPLSYVDTKCIERCDKKYTRGLPRYQRYKRGFDGMDVCYVWGKIKCPLYYIIMLIDVVSCNIFCGTFMERFLNMTVLFRNIVCMFCFIVCICIFLCRI